MAKRPTRRSRRASRSARRAGVIALLIVVVLGLAFGTPGLLVGIGLYAVGTGLWTLARGGSWIGRTGRTSGVGILVAGVVALAIGGTAMGLLPASVAETVRTLAPTSLDLGPASGVDTDEVLAAAPQSTALAAVAELEVRGRAPKTGYARDQFGQSWDDVDDNGCDTRNDILSRDLTEKTFKDGAKECVVLSGTLDDPYSGTVIDFQRGETTSTAVQIDHIVALSDAWQKGAQEWTVEKRTQFANDPLNLIAADGPLNGQKGDGDTATWLPPNNAFRCEYVARQVGVKVTYGLWVSEAERDAMVEVLSTCPDQPLPEGTVMPNAAQAATPEPSAASTSAPVAPADHYGSPSEVRAAGAALLCR
jgi:hypothetical protein